MKRVFALVFCVLYGTIARAQIDTLQYELKGSVLVSTGNKSGLKGRLSEGMTLERSLIDRMPQFLGSGDPIGLMRMLPGVQTVTEYESGIHICGGENSHNDVSVAGVPVFGVSHLFGFFSAFNPLHYQQISFSTSPDLRSNRIGGSILLALILIGTALVVFLCAKNRGRLTIGGKTLQLFPDGFNSLLFYFICVLWAIVLIACLLFGSGFAYYAMFAAIAVELIGAVYYTFQLK